MTPKTGDVRFGAFSTGPASFALPVYVCLDHGADNNEAGITGSEINAGATVGGIGRLPDHRPY